MTTPEDAVVARILALPAVTAIVGTRVWQLLLPQSATLPAVRVQRISGVEMGAHTRGARGVAWARIQIDAVAGVRDGANAYTTASELAEAIAGDGATTGVLGWKGSIGTPPLTIQGIFSLAEPVAEFEAEELQRVRIRRDVQVVFEE